MLGAKLKSMHTHSSILFKISILVTILCFIIMIYSFSRLYLGWAGYQHALELKTTQDITSPFTVALKNFMFERGRTNVVLAANDPISSENRVFIDERRGEADEAFEKGFSIMQNKYPHEAELLRKEYAQLKVLRNHMDEESQKPLLQRDPNSRTLWFTNCTDYINLVSSTLKKMGKRPLDKELSAYYELIIDSLHFRSIVGHESSLFTSAITGSKLLTQDEYAELLLLRGESKQIWADMEDEVQVLDSDTLIVALATVEEKYYQQFRPNQDRLLQLALQGEIYEGAHAEIAKLSVPALDSILLLADEAIQVFAIENEKNMKKGYYSFVSGLLQMLASILIIIFIPTYLKTRLVRPLNNIVGSIENLSAGQSDIMIPFVQRKDEIGKLAKGVEMLQKSMEEEQALKQELQDLIVKLQDLSSTDPLTGLYNRRYGMEMLNELQARYNRSKSLFSVIIGDIDYFKNINDSYGHDCGDFALANIARLISDCCREQDIIARWGGEEFLILLPDTDRQGADILAERIRHVLEEQTLQYENISFTITLTLGVAEYSEALGIEGTIKNADIALLQGKEQGRNRVVVF